LRRLFIFEKLQEGKAVNDYELLSSIRAEIHAEHTLISHRISWYIITQSFLMTAYAIAGGSNQWQQYFQFAMPVIGILLSELARWAIWAGSEVQNDLLNIESDLIIEMEEAAKLGKNTIQEMRTIDYYKRTTVYGRPTADWTDARAKKLPRMIPLLFIVAWIGALFCSFLR
jgi:hypothetical protein